MDEKNIQEDVSMIFLSDSTLADDRCLYTILCLCQ